jgi:2-polyprenyl-3-methyl-5-hydroxy-6-metoxy-1,4-benzoquinol methylase
MSKNNFFIKPGYKINAKPKRFNDCVEDALTYQLDVYRFAKRIAEESQCRSVLDIGCGFALKLAKYLHPLGIDITGIDEDHAISHCQREYSFGNWHVDNVEKPEYPARGPFDLIVSADVIEHLVDPDALLTYIRNCASPDTLVVISTPERDLRRGVDTPGPPQNPAHVREWNRAELHSYLADRGFPIVRHEIMDLREGMRTCQTVLCRPWT